MAEREVMKLSLDQIAEWTGAQLAVPHGVKPGEATGYSIDTRTLAPGDLFFAIRGERFDAHDFVATAFERGAVAAVVAKARLPELAERVPGKILLAVDDPLIALQTLAAAVRRKWGRRVVGITG